MRFSFDFNITRSASQPATETDSLNQPTGFLTRLWGAKSKSGVRVNQKSALGLSAVYGAVRILSETFASLPVHVHERRDNSRNVANMHPVHSLLAVSPHSYYIPFDFKAAMLTWTLMRGNGYALIERNTDGTPAELLVLDSAQVTPVVGDDDVLRYRVTGMRNLVEYEDMIHLKGLSFDGIEGKNPLEVARESIGRGIASQNYGSEVFENGSFLSGILTTDNPSIKPQQRSEMEDAWASRYQGAAGKGKTPVLTHGFKYQSIALNPRDAQFIESSRMTVEDVARIFRVPLHMLSHLADATFNNIETMSLEFVKYSLLPWVLKFEQECTRKLFTESEKGSYEVKMNVEGLQRGDFKTRTEGYAKMFGIGAMSQNDIRGLEDWNPIENGDTYYVPLNFTPDSQPNTETNNDE